MLQNPHFHQHTSEDSSLEPMPSETAFGLAADTFGLISDTSRLKILWLLCHHETCVNNIAVAVKMSSPPAQTGRPYFQPPRWQRNVLQIGSDDRSRFAASGIGRRS